MNNSIGNSLSFEDIPDSTEPIIAARRWNVSANGVLEPTNRMTYRWTPGENVARCDHSLLQMDFDKYLEGMKKMGIEPPEWAKTVITSRPHKVPSKDCQCGFYAMNRTFQLPYADATSIRGTVMLYGTVLIGQYGYRAEKARVHSLKVNLLTYFRPSVRRAAKIYGVPLRFFWPKITKQETAPKNEYLIRKVLSFIPVVIFLNGFYLSFQDFWIGVPLQIIAILLLIIRVL